MLKKILVALDVKLVEKLDMYAEELQFNRLQTIRYILKKYLDDYYKKGK